LSPSLLTGARTDYKVERQQTSPKSRMPLLR
jgi:hypothetical protein